MTDKIIRIAIDGPGGAGKSTVAKAVANRLNIDYIDTGAMYRAIAYKFSNKGFTANSINDPDFKASVNQILDSSKVDYSQGVTTLDGEDVSKAIRTSEITAAASAFSAIPEVRKKLVALQRDMSRRKSLVMDGRDIGTNVIKDAEVKIFLTASPEKRARRRYEELIQKGLKVQYAEILSEMKKRDDDDSSRDLNPLTMAEDAIRVDSSNMNVNQVVDLICDEIEKHS